MEKKKLTKRQVQAQNTHDKIYNIAIDLIEKKGFENITVAEICKVADVSVGSFYNCFKSKREILDRIFQLADDYFFTVVSDNIHEGTVQDKIIKFFNYYAQYNADRGIDFIKQLYTGKNNLFTTKGRPMQAVLQSIIENGQKTGQVSADMTAEEAVKFLFVAVRGVVYDWCLHDGEYDLTQSIDTYVRRLVRVL